MIWLQPGWKDFVALFIVAVRRQWRACIVFPLALVVGGCFLAPRSPDRPVPTAFSSLAMSVDGCETCHADTVSRMSATSAHGARGIRCGQCHRAGEHPDFTQPVADATCAGCHQAEYQQTLRSKHFVARARPALDSDRAARVALRRARFVVSADGSGKFAGDATSGELGGRLCAACHYDEHRLGRDGAQREDACTRCHAGRDQHYPVGAEARTNRCTQCHVRVGETVAGLIVNTHRFAMPGADGSEP